MIIDVILDLLLLVIFLGTAVIVILLLVYGGEFKRLWLEPMLHHPVVIFESDDWGVGPKEQVSALGDLLELFLHYRDQKHHHPVLTLGMVLAEPDVEKIKIDSQTYFRRDLSDENYRDLVQVINKGQKLEVFSVHLHGMEHFWPDSLMNAIHQEDVRHWLFGTNDGERITENLPSFLQSRWCDTSILPSLELKEVEIKKAIEAEKDCFKSVFEIEPTVVVPPTFVWTEAVIKQYVSQEIHLFVTPGRQYIGRDAESNLQENGRTFYNGDTDHGNNAFYLVRDVYFEPRLGHKADRVLTDIIDRTDCARPSLIEMHRFNFLSDKQNSLNELKSLLDIISEQLPQTLFLSVEELANVYMSNDLKLHSFLERFWIWIKRIQLFLQYKRLAKYSGFNMLLKLIVTVR